MRHFNGKKCHHLYALGDHHRLHWPFWRHNWFRFYLDTQFDYLVCNKAGLGCSAGNAFVITTTTLSHQLKSYVQLLINVY